MVVVETPLEVSCAAPSQSYMLSTIESYLSASNLIMNLGEESLEPRIPDLKVIALVYLPWAVKVLENMSFSLDQTLRQRVEDVICQARVVANKEAFSCLTQQTV